MSNLKISTTTNARKAYGPEDVDVTDDVSSEVLGKLKQQFLENHINISAHQCINITTSTVQQSQSGLSHSDRRKRITASHFGSIVKRNPSLPIQIFVRNMLYSSFSGNHHTRNGILQEDTTIEEYKLIKSC
jgi:ribosomal protein L13